MLRFYVLINAEQELFTETGRCRPNCSMHSLISPFPPPVTNSYSFHSWAAWITVIYVTMYFWLCFSNCLISHWLFIRDGKPLLKKSNMPENLPVLIFCVDWYWLDLVCVCVCLCVYILHIYNIYTYTHM